MKCRPDNAVIFKCYYPFGMLQNNRNYTAANGSKYRYGFNGKENDNEIKGDGNQQDYGMRIYDPRVGRFYSTDPLTRKYADLTPYQFASNRPIDGIDQDGLEYIPYIPKFQNSGNRTFIDYVNAFDNGAIDILNLVPTFWNSGVATVQSIRRGTYGEDLRRDTKQVGASLKQTAINVYNKPVENLTSPDALEFAVSTYIGARVLPGGSNKGNLLTPIKATSTSATETSIAANEIVAQGINGVKFSAGQITKLLTPAEGDMMTLYRGVSGKESSTLVGNKTLFFTQDEAYATAYAKQNGLTVQSYNISRSGFFKLKNEGLITHGTNNGVLVNSANETVATGGEISVSNTSIKNTILKSNQIK